MDFFENWNARVLNREIYQGKTRQIESYTRLIQINAYLSWKSCSFTTNLDALLMEITSAVVHTGGGGGGGGGI